MSYKDKTFCPKADKNNSKCIQCDRFFDENEYNIACDKAGFEIPVAWFLEPPCEEETGHSLTKRHYIPKSIRLKILQKYGGKCAYCGSDLTMKTMCIDHIYPIRKGGTDNLENYNPACRECNYYKSTLDIEQFKQRISTIIERLRKSFIFKLAIKYNLIEPKPFAQFYFEKIAKDNKEHR